MDNTYLFCDMKYKPYFYDHLYLFENVLKTLMLRVTLLPSKYMSYQYCHEYQLPD